MCKVGDVCPRCEKGKVEKRSKTKKTGSRGLPIDFLVCSSGKKCGFKKRIRKPAPQRYGHSQSSQAIW